MYTKRTDLRFFLLSCANKGIYETSLTSIIFCQLKFGNYVDISFPDYNDFEIIIKVIILSNIVKVLAGAYCLLKNCTQNKFSDFKQNKIYYCMVS